MARNATTGVYTLPTNATFNPAVNDDVLNPADWNALATDYSTALSHTASTTRALYPTTAQVQDGAVLWGGTAGGTATARTITLSPAITAYAAGQKFAFLNGAAANSGAMTLAVNGLTAQNVFRASGTALAAGDLPASGIINVQYDGTNFRLAGAFADPTPSANRGIIAGLVMSNNATDAVNDIDVTAGVARSDDNTTDITLSGALTKQLDVAWAAGTNQGMRDTGAISSGTWHIHLILNPTSGVVDILASLSATAPTMPSGYTKSRRIGAILRPASTILAFTQRGNTFLLTTAILDVNTAPSTAETLYTLSVPAGIVCEAMFRGIIYNGDITLGSPFETISAPAASGTTSSLNSEGLIYRPSHISITTNTSSQIKGRSWSASGTFRAITFGWTDFRGEFA